MVLENLGSKLKESLRKLTKAVFVDDSLLDSLVRDIQRALLQADVDVHLVFDLTKKIKERAQEEIPKKSDQRAHLVHIVYEELIALLGDEKSEIVIQKKKPFTIMMVGTYGNGKTTSIGKLAKYYHKRGYKTAAVGLDVHRPAASQQLKQVCDAVKIPSFVDSTVKDPAALYKIYEKQLSQFDIVFIDTAGRHDLDQELVREIKQLKQVIQPDEVLLVMSADLGQAAGSLAKGFHEACDITGIMITKLDGTAKGGGALSGASVSGAKVKFIGVGEKQDDLETFNPQGFVGRLLGMGDLETLLEKAQEVIPQEKAEDLGKKFLQGDFTLIDLYEQMQAMNKMGPLSKVLEMIPGMGQLKLPQGMLKVQEGKLEHWKYAMNSMTQSELENPDIIDSSRLQRISKGSGIPASEIRELLKQYRQSKKLMRMVKGQDPSKLMKKLQGRLPGMGG